MRFRIDALSPMDIESIAGWHYAAPYDVYDPCFDELPGDETCGLYAEDGELCGLFCWGEEACVEAARALYESDSDALDFGIGLRPDLTGGRLGTFAASQALDWLTHRFAPPAFRLAVYPWNLRAQKVYRRLGFTPICNCGAFLMMRLDTRPWRDASRPLQNGMPVYPSDPGFERRLFYTKEETGWDMSIFSMSAHTGTHIDAPAHIGLAGAVETLPLGPLNGSAQVVNWIGAAKTPVCSPNILIKNDGRGLTLDEATALLKRYPLTVIGIDAMSIGEGESERAVHMMLLEAGVIVLENAALEDFAPGWYEMRCLPLSMPGSDGAPLRLLLREEHA